MGGNCAGYCMADADRDKKKVTVEGREDAPEGRGIAYINENRGEFEIDYVRQKTAHASRMPDMGSGGN